LEILKQNLVINRGSASIHKINWDKSAEIGVSELLPNNALSYQLV